MAVSSAPSDVELREALAESGAGVPVRLRRQRSPYRTSFPLERLAVVFEGGEELSLAFKQLDWEGLDEAARLAKPIFLHDPRRELAVYRDLLAPAGLTTPSYFGAVEDEVGARHWLFVEWVKGRELYQVGEIDRWAEAAAWLAEMHATFLRKLDLEAIAVPLLEHDAAFYRCWMDRAVDFAEARDAGARRALAWLAGRHEAVVEALLALPRTVVHGEFYASNVLVAGEGGSARIAPLDWELAGRGSGLTDLAGLVSGDWSQAERDRIVAGYRRTEAMPGFSEADLSMARLQLAIQWLGWAPPEWEPPEGQRHDWLAEAVAIAEGLEL